MATGKHGDAQVLSKGQLSRRRCERFRLSRAQEGRAR